MKIKIKELGKGLLEVTYESEDPHIPDLKLLYTTDAWTLEEEFNKYVEQRILYGSTKEDAIKKIINER